MNKGCYYTAQGQFACQLETAATKKESFVIAAGLEHFAGPNDLDAWKLSDSYKGADFGNFKRSCLKEDVQATVDGKLRRAFGCKLNCGDTPNMNGKNTCSLSCSCAIDQTVDVNTDKEYCLRTQPGTKSGQCKQAKLSNLPVMIGGGNYASQKEFVNYHGQLYTLEEAARAKGLYERGLTRGERRPARTTGERRVS